MAVLSHGDHTGKFCASRVGAPNGEVRPSNGACRVLTEAEVTTLEFLANDEWGRLGLAEKLRLLISRSA
jgi:hypothetical protein